MSDRDDTPTFTALCWFAFGLSSVIAWGWAGMAIFSGVSFLVGISILCFSKRGND
jgi:hypothetical protein